MSRILIVEDEVAIADLEKDYLELSGFEVEIENEGDKGLRRSLEEEFDLIILDLMLPGVDGFEICRQIRIHKNTPVIMVSAKKDDIDKIRGLGLGADDYMTKPFSILELTARIRSLLRRSGFHTEKNQCFSQGGLEIDFDGRTVHVLQEQVELTLKEFELLKYLVQHKGKAVSRQELLNQIWGYDFVGESRTLDVHINSLRRKLGDPYDTWIQVIRGVGYRFVQDS